MSIIIAFDEKVGCFESTYEDTYYEHFKGKITREEFRTAMKEVNAVAKKSNGYARFLIPGALIFVFAFLILGIIALTKLHITWLGSVMLILVGVSLGLVIYYGMNSIYTYGKSMNDVIEAQNKKFYDKGVTWHFRPIGGQKIPDQIQVELFYYTPPNKETKLAWPVDTAATTPQNEIFQDTERDSVPLLNSVS